MSLVYTRCLINDVHNRRQTSTLEFAKSLRYKHTESQTRWEYTRKKKESEEAIEKKKKEYHFQRLFSMQCFVAWGECTINCDERG